MPLRALRVILASTVPALVLSGCTLSNFKFEEDPLFAGALPGGDDVSTEHPGSRDEDGVLQDDDARGAGLGPALVPGLSLQASQEVNGRVDRFLGTLEQIVSLPIVTREEDTRFWGPYAGSSSGGSALLRVDRSPDSADVFSYALGVSDVEPEDTDRHGSWEDVVTGDFTRTGESLRQGSGTFCWDADLHAAYAPEIQSRGVMCVDHVRADSTRTLHVDFIDWLGDDDLRGRESYYFQLRPDRGGVLEYVTRAQLAGSADGPLEHLAIRVRWRGEGSGRADFVVTDGDLADEVPGSECWDSLRERTWFRLEQAGVPEDEEEGDAGRCVYPDREDVREIVIDSD